MVRSEFVKVLRNGKPYFVDFDEVELPELDEEQLDAGDKAFRYKKFLIHSDPGAGKTLTACHALICVEEDRNSNYLVGARTLILCPKIAVRTWVVNVGAVYNDLNLDAQIEILPTCISPVTEGTTHLIVTHGMLSQGKLSADLAKTLTDFKADVLIVDESDAFTGLDAARVKVLFGPKYDAGIAGGIEYAWYLTGTPIPRYHDGLYPVLRNAFPDILEDMGVDKVSKFVDLFCDQKLVKYGNMRIPVKKVCGSKNFRLMRELLEGISARCKLKLNKPAIEEITIDCKFSDKFKMLEQEVLEGNDSDDGIQVIDPRLAQALRLMGTEAAPYVADYVLTKLQEKRRAGDKSGILLLFWHKDVGERLKEILSKTYKVGYISGQTTAKNNEQVEADFNAGKLDVCLGQIKAMGVALNLQKNCNHVIFAEDTFSATMNLQAYQRVWRRGQNRLVTVEFCRYMTELAEMRPSVAKKKEDFTKRVLA